MSPSETTISAEFPYTGQYATVRGNRMHYIESGAGEPVVFLHGNPTWSYLWRNVIPHVSPFCRCIAPDLMGMGRSDKPDRAYRFAEHAQDLEAFVDALGLERVTFVAHDWGGSLAFHYLANHPERVRGLAFMEVMLHPLTWAGFPRAFRFPFRMMRTPGLGWLLLSVANQFVERVLPGATVRRLGREEMAYYREPFATIRSRRPVRRWPCEIPLDGRPADVADLFTAYQAALEASPVPKLLLFAEPGGIVRESERQWAAAHLPALETVNVGNGIHYLQEDAPDAIGRNIADWYRRRIDPGNG